MLLAFDWAVLENKSIFPLTLIISKNLINWKLLNVLVFVTAVLKYSKIFLETIPSKVIFMEYLI